MYARYHQSPSKIAPFGCRAYVTLANITNRESKHFGERRTAGIYLGLAWHYGKKGCIVITDDYKRIYISTEVEFKETEFPARKDSSNHTHSISRDIQVTLQSDPDTNLQARIGKNHPSFPSTLRHAPSTQPVINHAATNTFLHSDSRSSIEFPGGRDHRRTSRSRSRSRDRDSYNSDHCQPRSILKKPWSSSCPWSCYYQC